jgi:hypothetical protein
MELNETNVVTARWSDVKSTPEQLRPEPVRISVGLPRFYAGSGQFEYISMLCPYGLFNKGYSHAEFNERYRARLDDYGVEKIREELERIAAASERDTIALCCFEDVLVSNCHRTVFAEWWEEQTGEEIEEYVPPDKQMAMA